MEFWLRALVICGLACALVLTPIAVPAQQAGDPIPVEQRVAKAREITQLFSDRLRAGLSAALKSGPAANAIGLCHTLAPDLTTQIGEDTGIELARVALKLRNPENAPDEWEEKVLQSFLAQALAGADVARLEHYEIIATAEGDKMFRYMRAIPVGEKCLACHGTDVKQDVKAEIARLYPEDKATGYRVGELRGAFSLIQLIEE